VAAVVLTLIVAVVTVLGPLPVAAAELQEAPVGNPEEQVKLTGVVKPVDVRNPTLVEPEPPGLAMVTLAKPSTATKPGWIVKVIGEVLLLAWKLASPA
jgi:hypothetical protein